MQTISNVGGLDAMLAECDAAATDDALRAVFGRYQMALPQGFPADPALDPLSDGYRSAQMDLYERISGRRYDLLNEQTPFDVAAATIRPFPYSTQSCATAGDHLVIIGQFLRLLDLPPASRVLELGPGWGNLTLALAALGHRVTAVDVEPRFCDLIRGRAGRAGLDIEVVTADFSWVASVEDRYDVIVFFECFHHAADHLALLRSLHSALLPSGRIILGAEPILTDFPVPWGLRMDGQSLWSIRKFGWMELGFNDAYFERALAATGWTGTRFAAPAPSSWVLRRADEPVVVAGTDARLQSVTGARTDKGIQLTDAPPGFGLYGPYVPLAPGRYTACVTFDLAAPASGTGVLEVSTEAGKAVVASKPIDAGVLSERAPSLDLAFELDRPCGNVEVRLVNDAGFSGCIARLTVARLPKQAQGQGTPRETIPA